MEDITKTGPVGLEGLSFQENQERSRLDNIHNKISYNLTKGSKISPYENFNYIDNVGLELVQSGIGTSKYDENITTDLLGNIGDVRANNQSNIAKIASGVAKGVILAGTTFLDGTIGLLVGATQAFGESRFSALWDNDFSKAMKDINEWSEEQLPNYYTDYEKDAPWYENIFTANFLGDKFIKNLGFAVGAFYSGGLYAGGARSIGRGTMALAKRSGATISTIKNIAKTSSIVAAGVGSATSAINEGRIEALNNSTDWFNYQKAQLDDNLARRLQALNIYKDTNIYTSLLEDAYNDYNSTLAKISEDRLKMGNADLLLNLPILLGSNIIQFGKLYANGFNTAKKTLNIVGSKGNYKSGSTKIGALYNITKGALSEGTEELLQKTAAETSGNYYSTDVNNFYEAKINPDAEQETLSWMKALMESINTTVNDSSSWEEFTIGALTGFLGIPSLRSIKNAEGKIQSPITLQGGAINEWKKFSQQKERENTIVNYLNNRLNSPEYINYYQGLIRHNKYQSDMNSAVENDDTFNFKNAEHAQLVSDIIMFDNAGKIEDLKQSIVEASGTSREDLEALIKNTTTKNKDNKLVGPFSQFATTNENGDIIANLGTEDSIKQVSNKINSNREEILNTINEYQKIKDNLILDYGDVFTDEQISELTWIQSQINNWENRGTDLYKGIKITIGKVLGNLESKLSFNLNIRNSEGKNNANLTDLYLLTDKNIQTLERAISNLEVIKSLNNEDAFRILLENPNYIEGLIKEIEVLDDNIINDKEKESSIRKLKDIKRINEGYSIYNSKLKEYLTTPDKYTEDNNDVKNSIIEQDLNDKASNLVSSLSKASNLQEFRNIIESNNDSEIVESALNNLESSDNTLVKNYKETNSYRNKILKYINNSIDSTTIKNNAIKLFNAHFNSSENLNELKNTESIYINNSEILYEDSLSIEENNLIFNNSKALLLKAINKVNSDDKFKDGFSKENKKSSVNGSPNLNNPDKDTTGNSNTSTIPSVNSENSYVKNEIIGDYSSDQVEKEIKEFNNFNTFTESLDNNKEEKRNYYRPAIPELHIEASKEGDFRPFNEVVKEREGKNFDKIYNYLKDSGAFDYVNNGNLTENTEIGFLIDPNFNDSTIFIIDKKNNQIIGSLDESQYSISRYEGLSELINSILEEYRSKGDNSNIFIASPTTRILEIMIGKIPYSKQERSLSDIPNIVDSKAPIFGIIKNGILDTNNRLSDSLIIKPVDMSNKEGRMYLLLPNAKGKYSPAAVRVKHFNKNEFNPADVVISSTPMYKNIQDAINKLANSESETDLTEAVKFLSTYLYTGNLHIDWINSSNGLGIRFTKVEKDEEGREIYESINGELKRKEESKVVFLTDINDPNLLGSITGDNEVQYGSTKKSIEEIYNNIINTLLDFNLPIQINIGMLNNGGYNNMLINSNILTSNILNAKVLGSWFTLQTINNKLSKDKIIKNLIPNIDNTSPIGGIESIFNGIKITHGGSILYVDLQNNIVTDINGNKRNLTSKDTILIDLAWAENTFGPINKDKSNSIVTTPSGLILNRELGIYEHSSSEDKNDLLNLSEISKIEKELNNLDEEFEDEFSLYKEDNSIPKHSTVKFIVEDVPLLTSPTNRSKVKAFLRVGYSLREISNIIGEDLLTLSGYRGIVWDKLTKEQRSELMSSYTPEKTLFDSEYKELGYQMNVEYNIEDITKLLTDDLYSSKLFSKILEIAKQFGITIVFRNKNISDDTLGLYGFNKIFIQISPKDSSFQSVIMHELIHSVTQGIINKKGTGELNKDQEEALNILEEVFNNAKSYGEPTWYGLSNLSEFIAELSNPKFRDFLKGQKVNKHTTLWDKVLQFFRKIFDNNLDISDNSLEKLLNNPIKDDSKSEFYKRNRTAFNKDLSTNEKLFIEDFLLNINDYDRTKGHSTIYNKETHSYYIINFSPTFNGYIENKKTGGDGFEVMHIRRSLKNRSTENAWNILNSTIKSSLINKGWTMEMFNLISEKERNKAIECLSL